MALDRASFFFRTERYYVSIFPYLQTIVPTLRLPIAKRRVQR